MSEAITCPLCGDTKSWPVPFVDPDRSGKICRDTGYHWRCCTHCGNAFPTPAPTLPKLQEYWNRNRVVLETVNEEAVWKGRYREAAIWANRTWDVVKPYMHEDTGNFLDIACGLGATVKLFQDRGWQAEGLDADPNTQPAHERLGIKATIGQVEHLQYAERFDFISIAHAVYFVTDPLGFIRRVHGMLKSDGMFLVVLSDLLSAHSEGGPSYAHTWFSTADSLALTLKQEGFKILHTVRITGSTFVLAALDAEHSDKDDHLPPGRAFQIYLLYRTHSLRQVLIGCPRRILARTVKNILRIIRRA